MLGALVVVLRSLALICCGYRAVALENLALAGYLSYYHYSRTHLSLAKDAPTPRRVQAVTDGDVIAAREVGGLHHRYERRVA
jgi:hypothetical protein